MPLYVAQALFIGSAADEFAFCDLVEAALNGDDEAREQLRKSVLHITAIDPEPHDG